MRTIRLLLFLVLPWMVESCVDDTFTEQNRVEEGLPVNAKIKFNAEALQIITRAEQNETSENQVGNLYVFIFNEHGDKHYSKFCTEGNGLSYADGSDKRNSGFAELNNTTSLNNARIVGIANLNTSSVSTVYGITPEQLDAINTLSELEAQVMQMSTNTVERGSFFLMIGYATNDAGEETVDIPGSETGTVQTLKCQMKLRRSDAKVRFIVTAEKPNDKNWTDFSFEPREWTVKRVPKQSYLLENNNGDYDGDGNIVPTYFTTPAMSFEDITRDESQNYYTGGSFVFYIPENRKVHKRSIESTGTSAEQYAKREEWDTNKGEDENGDKTFLNANANSTYVEMTGTLSYQDGNQKISADVRMTVHLGYVTKRDGQPITPDPNDYNTERNTFYTYRVTIHGVDDIQLEVESKTDKRPGYEGEVVIGEADGIFEFDSHYDRRLIQLNRSVINDNMRWSVNTPFSHGIQDAVNDATTLPANMRDYRWIKFAINRLYGVADNTYAKYPGDLNYNDPFPIAGHEGENNKPAPYYTDYPNARLMDINQLICYLQANKNNNELFDSNGNVHITAFVDENVYYCDPTEETHKEQPLLWKKTADKGDRQLHIITGEAATSDDGNSTVVHSTYSFKQRSLRTIFNVDKEELKTAWGLESTMETERLPVGDVSQGNDTRNGRANCLKWLTNKKWTEVLSTSDHYALNENFNNAAYACLLRNRDLDGDNIVDADEVRWYLASIDQLTDIYIGEYALDEKSRLYPTNPADRPGGNGVYWHYTSSSYNADEGNAWVFWAEEGASRGSYTNDNNTGSVNLNGSLYSYRCIRNLGIPLDQSDVIPEDLVSVKPQGNDYLIDMTNMSIKSRRTNKEETAILPAHTEKEATNRPYAKFLVGAVNPAPQYHGTNGDGGVGIWGVIGASDEGRTDLIWENLQNWSYYQTRDNQNNGYRIPNQRELLIMSTRLPKEAWPTYTVHVHWYEGKLGGEDRKEKDITEQPPYYICQTKFSMVGKNPYNDYRRGFIWSTSGIFFLQNNDDEKGYVRLVKDTD